MQATLKPVAWGMAQMKMAGAGPVINIETERNAHRRSGPWPGVMVVELLAAWARAPLCRERQYLRDRGQRRRRNRGTRRWGYAEAVTTVPR